MSPLLCLHLRFRLGPGPAFGSSLAAIGLLRQVLRLPAEATVHALRARAPAPPAVEPGTIFGVEAIGEGDVDGLANALLSGVEDAFAAASREVELAAESPPLVLPRWVGPVVIETLSPVRFPLDWQGEAAAAHFWNLARLRLEGVGRSRAADALGAVAERTQRADFEPVRTIGRPSAGVKVRGRVLVHGLEPEDAPALRLLELLGVGSGTLVGLGHIVLRPGARTRVLEG